MTTLTTDRLTLRRPGPQDAEAITEFYISERSAMAGGHVPRPQAWRNYAYTLGHWQARGYGLWAVTRKGDDRIIGLVGPYFPEGWPETEIGWLMFDGAEGHGYAFEAAKATIADARNRLGWTDIVHYIAHGNDRSVALAKRLGATEDPQARIPNPDKPCHVFRQPGASA